MKLRLHFLLYASNCIPQRLHAVNHLEFRVRTAKFLFLSLGNNQKQARFEVKHAKSAYIGTKASRWDHGSYADCHWLGVQPHIGVVVGALALFDVFDMHASY